MTPFKIPFIPPVTIIETPRLNIRVDSEEQYVAYFGSASDEELMRWYGFSKPEELIVQKQKIAGGFSNYRTSTVLFHLGLKDSGEVIGSMAFHNWYQVHRRSEIGYAMTSEARKGQGYMTEALAEVLQFGYEAMDLNRIEAFTAPDNEPSRRMLRRAGFAEEGMLREHYIHQGTVYDSVLYARLRSDLAG